MTAGKNGESAAEKRSLGGGCLAVSFERMSLDLTG